MNLRCTEYDTSLTSTQEPFTPGVPSDRAAGCLLEGWLRPGWLVRMESRCNAISALLVHDERSHLAGGNRTAGPPVHGDDQVHGAVLHRGHQDVGVAARAHRVGDGLTGGGLDLLDAHV